MIEINHDMEKGRKEKKENACAATSVLMMRINPLAI